MNAHSPIPQAGLPANIEAEQALLGAILVNNDAFTIASEHVRADQFSEGLHERIFEICGDLITQGRSASPVAIKSFLDDVDLGGITVSQYLGRLAAEATTIVNAPDFAKTIAEMATRREMIARAQEMIAAASQPDPRVSALSILERHEGGLSDIKNQMMRSGGQATTLDGAVDKLVKRLTRKRQGLEAVAPTTGFIDLDRLVGGGFRPRRLYMFGARPGMGKTTLLVASARRTAKKGNGVGILSLEIDDEENAARFVASAYGRDVAPLNYSDILTGNIPESRDADIEDMRRKFVEYPVEIDCTEGLNLGAIESRVRGMNDRLKRKGFPLEVLYIDYLGLIAGGERYKGSKVAEIGELVLGLRNMAKRMNIAVVLFSQLNRGVESRDDKRPTKEDLRDSGNIEEHADVIGLLYRPAHYDEKIKKQLAAGLKVEVEDGFETLAENRKHDLEIILDKNRLGPKTTVTLYCDVGRALVEDGAPKWTANQHDFGGF